MSEMNYPPEELGLKGKIDALMREWKKHCDGTPAWKGYFVSDGFFPYYTKQAVKILFIGRESCGLGGGVNYIDEYVGMNTPNFHDRLLYLAYGIINGKCSEQDWLDMPNAGRLDKSLATPPPDGFSYAFMNASKIDNHTGKSDLDKAQFNGFIEDEANREFIIEEIKLLDPDIIISANLGDLGFFKYFNDKYGIEEPNDKSLNTPDRFIRYIALNGKSIPWIDGWHFSAHKNTFECFYKPICSIAPKLTPHQQSYITTKLFQVAGEVFSHANLGK